jgi:methylenetetrahydrofolate reductase (NADPH)
MMTLREKHQQGQFTITVELDPPKSSSAEKTFEQAARLKGKVDAINIADSPMSKMRMSPISLSYLLQHNKEIETIFHLTCRDRNIIGLQSELLGAAALGVHNILTLTGDKPDNGDHPFAQSVFEVDCMGLLNIAKTLNAGKDLAGNDLDAPTNFYIGATGNPGALDLEIERQKLAAKIQNGAHFVQTQPIYDLEQAKRYIDKMSEFDVPIMLGLIPLKSFKMATYLHEKVPGINLTQEILDRMEKGGKEAGTEIAIETLEQIKKMAAGVHIMPLNDIDTTLYIIDHV